MFDWLKQTNSIPHNSRGVYKILNLINNKVYIGISTNLRLRLKKHYHGLMSNKHPNKHLQNSVNVHGMQNFVFEIIERVDSPEDAVLMQKEHQYQVFYKATMPENGYNIQITDITGKIRHTENFKIMMREKMTGRLVPEETKARLSKAFKGKSGHKHTENFKIMMREKMVGRYISPETRNKIAMAKIGKPNPMKGKPGKKYTDEQKAAVKRRMSGNSNPRAVKIIDNNGEQYGSIKEVMSALNISRSTAENYIKKGKLKRI